MSESQTLSRQQRRAQERKRRKQAGRLSPGAALTLGAAALAAVPAAQAATFTVTNTNDAGAGSLRQAIIDANGAAGADIVDAAGVTGTITLTTGQLAVTDSVDIQGPGAASLTVNGGGTGRVFYLYSGAGLIDVTISDLTIAGGGAVTFGAGIIDFGENLTVDGVVISGNVANAGGGAIAATDLSGDGMSLTVRDSTISGNDSGRDGGGIYFYATGGPLVIENSVISGNDAVDDGGGIYLYDITDDLTITNSTISGNTASTGLGGGVYFYQTDGGTQTIDHSTFDNNTATAGVGGGIMGVFTDTPLTIDHSTFSNNDATAGGGMFFAFAFGAPIVVTDSTISGNQATANDGGGIFLYGLYAGGTFAIESSTIAGNTAAATGGGAFTLAGPVPIENSIVGDNTGASDGDLGTALAGNFDLSFTLVEAPGTANITDSGGNILNQDPQLGPLANNGGLTLTHKPAATSPAVNAGNPAFAPPPATDQRDLPRVVNTVIDMGSVELGASGTIQLTFSTSSVAENAGTVTVTATRTGGSEGAVSVTLNTVDGAAIAPGDYTAVVGGVLSWADGDTAPKSINITIINDVEDEPDENFIVTISNPTGGATLGSPATATITILDDDEPISVIEVPTVGEWGLVFLTGLLAMAGMYRLRRKQGLAAPLLILTLMAGGANIASAASAASAATPRVRDAARVVTLSQVVPSAGTVSLQLSDGTIVQVNVADLEIKDRRDPRGRLLPPLRVQDLAAGQPMVVKVRRGENGVVKKVRVQVFDTLARAQQAAQRHDQ